MKRALAFVAVAGFAGTAIAGDDVLWDQQPDASINAIVDQVFPDSPDFDTYTVNDVELTGEKITSVTTYFTQGFGFWPTGDVPAVLNIFENDGSGSPAASDDPTAGMDVTANLSVGSAGLELTASGLDISPINGQWWVGLTPVLDFGIFGQEFHQSSSSLIGDLSHFRNPGGGFGLGTEWNDSTAIDATFVDAALTIQGIIPAPATAGLLALGGLGLARRRR